MLKDTSRSAIQGRGCEHSGVTRPAADGTYFQNRVPFLVCIGKPQLRYHFKALTSLSLLAKCHTRTPTNNLENIISNNDDDYPPNGSPYWREINKLAVEMNRKYLHYIFTY